jgi:hypothetical protein
MITILVILGIIILMPVIAIVSILLFANFDDPYGIKEKHTKYHNINDKIYKKNAKKKK